jgi:hypothetical protein
VFWPSKIPPELIGLAARLFARPPPGILARRLPAHPLMPGVSKQGPQGVAVLGSMARLARLERVTYGLEDVGERSMETSRESFCHMAKT